MQTVAMSDKGQVTIPAEVRRQKNLHGHTKLQVEVRGDEIVLRPIKSLMELEGIFAQYARGEYVPFEEAREIALAREAAEVAREGLD